MAIKCIAIGSRLMADDRIAIAVLEAIAAELQARDIEVIISETDVYYAFSQIEDGDFLFIIDATCYNIEPGTIIYTPIDEAISRGLRSNSLHQESLIDLLRISKIAVRGFIIGIEASEICFNYGLSEILKIKFPLICSKVIGIISYAAQYQREFPYLIY